MTDTPALIAQLAARAAPVRPLAAPLWRTLAWLAFAAVLVGAVVMAYGPRAGLMRSVATPAGAGELLASLATGIAAAYATFQVSVPGRSRRWLWLPLPPLLAWLGGLGWVCASEASRIGHAAFAFEADVRECALAITLVSLPLASVLLVMVRHAGVVRPAASAGLAMLAAAALSSFGVSLFHQGDTAWMVVVWHVGAVALLSLGCLLFGRPLFAWIGYARA